MVTQHSAHTKSSAWRNNQENDNLTPWGDKPTTLTDKDHILQFCFLNIGGFPTQNPRKLQQFKTLCSTYTINVASLAEMDWNFSKVPARQRPSELLHGWRKFAPRTALSFFKDSPVHGAYTYGGTATMAFHTAQDRSQTVGDDPHGLGHWSWICLQGKANTATRIVSCYRSQPRNGSALEGTWNHQKMYFDQHEIPGNPWQLFLDNLAQKVRAWQASGNSVVLGIDLNEDVGI